MERRVASSIYSAPGILRAYALREPLSILYTRRLLTTRYLKHLTDTKTFADAGTVSPFACTSQLRKCDRPLLFPACLTITTVRTTGSVRVTNVLAADLNV